ncbi:hypothetical protein DFH06DRAFT_927897, partial [Mycena polygramma]
AVISGSTVAAAMKESDTFTPNDLDIYTPFGTGYSVVQFLKRAGTYSVLGLGRDYDFATGIGKVWTMRNRCTGLKINVIESLTPYAMDSVLHFHSSCLFGAWTARGWWPGYPWLTAAGFTMTTPSRM